MSQLFAQNKTLGVTSLPEGTRKRAAVIFANQDYKIDQYDITKAYNDADDMKAALTARSSFLLNRRIYLAN
ncbi:hypothetical protein GCM10028810_51520 [Spirosoma litoris]